MDDANRTVIGFALRVGGVLALLGALLFGAGQALRKRRSNADGPWTQPESGLDGRRDRANEPERPPVARALPSDRRPSGPIEALLAEDNDVNAQILTRQLEKLGLQVTRVTTGADAVALAEQRDFDVVLLDWRMPEMDGLQAIQRLRRLPVGDRLPIAIITANAMPGDRETCLAAGADAYLVKPVAFETLRSVIADFKLFVADE